MKKYFFLFAILFFVCISVGYAQKPPYSGTIFIERDIINASDSSTFVSSTYIGQELRRVFDRRKSGMDTINAYLFKIVWSDGLTSEAVVNPEFGSDTAAIEASKYGRIVGQLPKCLRTDVRGIWIHKGIKPFGGGNHSILIHTGQTALYEKQGILEETLVHEASHTSLDSKHASAEAWLAAQKSDSIFISTYARDNPRREDIAESFLLWMGVRQCTNRISEKTYNTVMSTMPNRIKYFDSHITDIEPFCVKRVTSVEEVKADKQK
jgi:hypothetical protein